ncbi:MAG: type II toxin-antitoxin system RelE/ParE family toxin [Candidatus Electrothrix sp. AR4]|nr:type II toxin-antitoxin system RelE/ParE family toxin [Candidatus Electrothrix sp. AR4]
MHQVDFTPTAANDLKRLNKPVAQRVFSKIRWLSENFSSLSPVSLTGQWSGVYKLRVGDYRVLYTFSKEKESITIHFVRHRREVYKMK